MDAFFSVSVTGLNGLPANMLVINKAFNVAMIITFFFILLFDYCEITIFSYLFLKIHIFLIN